MIDPSKQSIFFIDIGVIAHVIPKKVSRITKSAPDWRLFAHLPCLLGCILILNYFLLNFLSRNPLVATLYIMCANFPASLLLLN